MTAPEPWESAVGRIENPGATTRRKHAAACRCFCAGPFTPALAARPASPPAAQPTRSCVPATVRQQEEVARTAEKRDRGGAREENDRVQSVTLDAESRLVVAVLHGRGDERQDRNEIEVLLKPVGVTGMGLSTGAARRAARASVLLSPRRPAGTNSARCRCQAGAKGANACGGKTPTMPRRSPGRLR